jgi:hypothetical protein
MKECIRALFVLVVCVGGTLWLQGHGEARILVFVEPDDFALGTDLGTAFPGVTLSVTEFSGVPVIAGSGLDGGFQLASTGTQVFARQQVQDNGGYWQRVSSPGLGSLRIDFAEPTDFVAIDMIGPDDSVGELQVFDAAGTLLETFTTDRFPRFAVVTVSITRSTADIAYAIAGGIPGESLLLDNLRFNGEGYFTQVATTLEECIGDLDAATADSDQDGHRDLDDACPGTAAGATVDQTGCSLAQFCAAIDATTSQGEKTCQASDWQNDEPLMTSRDADCTVEKGGPGRADDHCVPRL